LLVTVPAGEVRYGTPPESPEAAVGTGESPAFPVRLAKAFLMSRTEITVAQFQAFAEATGLSVEPRCQAYAGGWVVEDGMDWRTAGEATLAAASPELPVTCVSWNDARAYVEWLSTTTGRKYRLPSEVEWEYAARAGSSAARSFVTKDAVADALEVSLCDNANVYDRAAIDSYPPRLVGHWQAGCADGAEGLAKAGSRQPNAFDLLDLLGNAREWVQDCQTTSRTGAPLDGRAWEWSGCTLRGIRGGSFLSDPSLARSAARERAVPTLRAFDLGFRVVREAAP
jgi:formylglycine-generating enzyme required for sulfatase activity